MRAEQLTDVVTHHGEGPVWWPGWGVLRCVDLMAGDVLDVVVDGGDPRGPAGAVTRTHVGERAACLRPRAGEGDPRTGEGTIIALERTVALADSLDLVQLRHHATITQDERVRANDGACDPLGRFLIGTMAYDQAEGAARLYRLEETTGRAAGQPVLTTVLEGVTVSNGLGWSPDGTLAYYNDSPTRQISVLDSDDAGLHERRPFVTLPDDIAGYPDGLCVDAEGGVWVALYDGGAVHRYDASGELSEVVELPVRSPTAVALAGADLRTLVITTTRENVPDGEDPLAGALFALRVQTPGLLPLPFHG